MALSAAWRSPPWASRRSDLPSCLSLVAAISVRGDADPWSDEAPEGPPSRLSSLSIPVLPVGVPGRSTCLSNRNSSLWPLTTSVSAVLPCVSNGTLVAGGRALASLAGVLTLAISAGVVAGGGSSVPVSKGLPIDIPTSEGSSGAGPMDGPASDPRPTCRPSSGDVRTVTDMSADLPSDGFTAFSGVT